MYRQQKNSKVIFVAESNDAELNDAESIDETKLRNAVTGHLFIAEVILKRNLNCKIDRSQP